MVHSVGFKSNTQSLKIAEYPITSLGRLFTPGQGSRVIIPPIYRETLRGTRKYIQDTKTLVSAQHDGKVHDIWCTKKQTYLRVALCLIRDLRDIVEPEGKLDFDSLHLQSAVCRQA